MYLFSLLACVHCTVCSVDRLSNFMYLLCYCIFMRKRPCVLHCYFYMLFFFNVLQYLLFIYILHCIACYIFTLLHFILLRDFSICLACFILCTDFALSMLFLPDTLNLLCSLKLTTSFYFFDILFLLV